MTLWTALPAIALAVCARAGNREIVAGEIPAAPQAVSVSGLPALNLRLAAPAADVPRLAPSLEIRAEAAHGVSVLHPAPQTAAPAHPGGQRAQSPFEQQAHDDSRKFDGVGKVSAQSPGVEASASVVSGAALVEPALVLDGAAAVAGLAKADRNWYFKSIKQDPDAVERLRQRLDKNKLPARALERRLLVDALLVGVDIEKVVGVYRYGSSVWGHKSQPPSDMDALVVVEGKAKQPSTQTREALSVVSEADPRSFAIYMNEESASQPGLLPLNVTVVSREYIRDFMKEGKAPQALSSMGIGDLAGDWGHGVLVYGQDALASLKPKASELVQGAADTVRNAGGFMENFIYKVDGRKAQSMSLPSAGNVAEAENDKLPPKIYLRHVEAQLRMRAAMELQGRDEATIARVVGADPRETYLRYLTGADFPELPGKSQALVESTIGLSNGSDGMFTRLRRADMTPSEIRRETLADRLRGAALVLALASLLPMFIVGWSNWMGGALALALAAMLGAVGLARAPAKTAATPAAAEQAADSAAPAEALVAAFENGTLEELGASPRQKALLQDAADRAVRATLAEGKFKVFYHYGSLLPTMMYEAPELPGVLLKTYGAPFYLKGKAWKGYNLAKNRLGGLFAETTIVENVSVDLEGKPKTLSWALVQEKVQVAGTQSYKQRETQVLLGMLKRGVRDNDQRQRGFEELEHTRNLGATPDGRFVHFDADFFGAEKDAEEGPKRVRDPPILRAAIRAAQLAALKADAR